MTIVVIVVVDFARRINVVNVVVVVVVGRTQPPRRGFVPTLSRLY